MDHRNDWFAPENVEEQIAHYQHSTDTTTANARLLHDLQDLAASDAQRLTKIRERLVKHTTHNQTREPVPLQRYRQTEILQFRSQPRQAKKQSTFLIRVISGIAAVFVILSMLLALTLFKSHSQQQNRNVSTPTVKSIRTDVVPVPIIQGKAAFLINTTTNQVLASKNAHAPLPMASLALMMTAVVAIDNADLNQYVTVDQATLNEVPSGSSLAGLQAGDQIQLSELLYALLLPSGSDAAYVIAHAVGGNVQNFVAMMNNEAQQLHLSNTHFSSPISTSTSDQYTSAADITYLTQYALQLSSFSSVITSSNHSLADTSLNHRYAWTTTNDLPISYPGLHVIQAGYNPRDGAYMVFSVQRNDHLLIGVETGAPSQNILVTDVRKLL